MPALQGHADTAAFHAAAAKTARLGPALQASVRRRLRPVAAKSVRDVQSAVMQEPAAAGAAGKHTGLRQGLAASVEMEATPGTAGFSISSNGSALPASQQSLVQAWDKPSGFLHPVFDDGVSVTQVGRPYFATVVPRRTNEMTAAMVAAMDDAAQTLQ